MASRQEAKTHTITRGTKCFFSENPEYKKLEVIEVFKKDPEFILWAFENLDYLEFDTRMRLKIGLYKNRKDE